ncbi:MAG: alpha/beta hydrolase [Acidobacteriota bacterium]
MKIRILLVTLGLAMVAGQATGQNSPSPVEKMNARQLIDLARRQPEAATIQAIVATFGREALEKGTAAIGEGPDFFWAVEAQSEPALFVDDQARPAMVRISGTGLWYQIGKLRAGTSHTFHYLVEGKKFGGNLNLSAYGPDSYQHPGVPAGKLSERLVHTSKIYDGMQSNYWTYVPAQYRPDRPAALMVWQDGHNHVDRSRAERTLNVIDNLTAAGKIPVIVHVFVSPGEISMAPGAPTHQSVSDFSTGSGRTLKDSMRSVEYDTVSDRYARFLRDELLADVQARYNIRRDGYSRAIAGNSSGGICAFNTAWQQPDQFSRVLSHIGTYTSIQWKPGVLDGGNIYPFKVRKEPRKNLRIWLQDGSEDLENTHGSWPLQNIQLANSLKMAGYDFHFSFGNGSHSGAQGNAELPESLAWLWRDYDPGKTEQVYQMDPLEKDKPLFRVRIYNRE